MEKHKTLTLTGEVNKKDLAAFLCDLLMLGVFLYNHIFYDLNMWFGIIPLLIIGIYLGLFCVIPEKYRFTETSLEIWHLCFTVTTIPYTSVFNYEFTQKDHFINLLQDNKVKVYYTKNNSKRLTVPRPKDVHAFVGELKKRCPEFEDNNQPGKLDVFWKDTTK